jgi:hypothetical protein
MLGPQSVVVVEIVIANKGTAARHPWEGIDRLKRRAT